MNAGVHILFYLVTFTEDFLWTGHSGKREEQGRRQTQPLKGAPGERPMQGSGRSAPTEASRGLQGAQEMGVCLGPGVDRGVTDVMQGHCVN